MQYVETTLSTPEMNLACDEALLEMCEDGYREEILRFWEPRDYFVVLGSSNSVATEVNLAECRMRGIPVLRRHSGGGAVVQGPGCFNYALILTMQRNEHLMGIAESNAYIMEENRKALAPLLGEITVQGHTDLVMRGLKFSGNSQRRKQKCLLFHGTFLVGLDIQVIEELLPIPTRQPGYRASRAHRDFVTNMNISSETIKQALRRHWDATSELTTLPLKRMEELAREKYSTNEWTFRF